MVAKKLWCAAFFANLGTRQLDLQINVKKVSWKSKESIEPITNLFVYHQEKFWWQNEGIASLAFVGMKGGEVISKWNQLSIINSQRLSNNLKMRA